MESSDLNHRLAKFNLDMNEALDHRITQHSYRTRNYELYYSLQWVRAFLDETEANGKKQSITHAKALNDRLKAALEALDITRHLAAGHTLSPITLGSYASSLVSGPQSDTKLEDAIAHYDRVECAFDQLKELGPLLEEIDDFLKRDNPVLKCQRGANDFYGRSQEKTVAYNANVSDDDKQFHPAERFLKHYRRFGLSDKVSFLKTALDVAKQEELAAIKDGTWNMEFRFALPSAAEPEEHAAPPRDMRLPKRALAVLAILAATGLSKCAAPTIRFRPKPEQRPVFLRRATPAETIVIVSDQIKARLEDAVKAHPDASPEAILQSLKRMPEAEANDLVFELRVDGKPYKIPFHDLLKSLPDNAKIPLEGHVKIMLPDGTSFNVESEGILEENWTVKTQKPDHRNTSTRTVH